MYNPMVLDRYCHSYFSPFLAIKNMTSEEKQIAAQIAAEKVADLWIVQMKKPMNKDNGDDNGMLFMLATQVTMRSQEAITTEQLQAFKTKLISSILTELIKNDQSMLSCDYGPDFSLGKIAHETGIPANVFPWKSFTTINLIKQEIGYRFGYRAGFNTIPI